MKTININSQEGVKCILFPDNQPHVVIEDIKPLDKVKVICRLKSSLDLMNLMQVSNAITHSVGLKVELHIPYLMAARYDRHMIEGAILIKQD